jgi:hypothetical protein
MRVHTPVPSKKKKLEPDVVVYIDNPSTQETEEGESGRSSRPAWGIL